MTSIEWTTETLNPVTGCAKVSPGCDNCYAEGIANRWGGPGTFDTVVLHPERLAKPLRWRKPRKVFVNSMSDLFHQDVPDDLIARLWIVMALTPQHTYQILTKRPARTRSLLTSPKWVGLLRTALCAMLDEVDSPMPPDRVDAVGGWIGRPEWTDEILPPLPNVWLGTSVEDQHWADIRIPVLLGAPAVVRFISAEPLLGPVDLTDYLWVADEDACGDPDCCPTESSRTSRGDLHWIICGGESGPKARPMDVEWVRSIVRQGQEAAVPVFVKQLGTRWAREYGGPSKGGDPSLWPADLRVREYPQEVRSDGTD